MEVGQNTLSFIILISKKKFVSLIDDKSYGDPNKILSWTTMSFRKSSDKLESEYQIKASHMTIKHLLKDMGYSSQSNAKMLQVDKPHPDMNEQFLFINSKATQLINEGIQSIYKQKHNIV
ncbi:MAG: hypothetical protein LBT40_16710 [Deltaproteobacteria bacterium]|jgi:hypothetical protein|nr:hypothetical protein [Deltaproteobacteria bacterium]